MEDAATRPNLLENRIPSEGYDLEIDGGLKSQSRLRSGDESSFGAKNTISTNSRQCDDRKPYTYTGRADRAVST